ncbi:MAG: hypothetical protein ABR587_15640, partial [Candidatus Binatia bacterium]
MTAAEILRSAEPPPDDGVIEKAIAELDVRIWEWADALKNAHSQLRGAFAARPATRPSAALYDDVPPALSSLSAAAAAAHIPSPPPMPAEWTAPPPAPDQSWSPSHGGHGASANAPTAKSNPSWADLPATPASASGNDQVGVMSWPSTPANNWPDSTGTSSGAQAWPTWTPTDVSATSSPAAKKGSAGAAPSARPGKAAKPRPVPEGPSPEERAQKAAAEEALLSGLEEAIARRVRLLRRLDPDTAIEKLIDK